MTAWSYLSLSLMCHLTCYFLSGMVYIGCSYLVFDCWQSAVQSLPQTQTSITLPLSLRFLCLHHLFKQVSLTSQNIGKAHRQHPVVSTVVSFSVCQCVFYNYKRLKKVWMLIFSAFIVSLKFSIFFNSSCICSLLSLMTWLLFVLPVEPQVWCFYWSLHSRH